MSKTIFLTIFGALAIWIIYFTANTTTSQINESATAIKTVMNHKDVSKAQEAGFLPDLSQFEIELPLVNSGGSKTTSNDQKRSFGPIGK